MILARQLVSDPVSWIYRALLPYNLVIVKFILQMVPNRCHQPNWLIIGPYQLQEIKKEKKLLQGLVMINDTSGNVTSDTVEKLVFCDTSKPYNLVAFRTLAFGLSSVTVRHFLLIPIQPLDLAYK
jgi:hypothetical protein